MKVVLVDDHPLIRSGLANALGKNGFEIVGEAASTTEGWAVINSTIPQICIVDINLGNSNGIDLVKRTVSTKLDCKFVVLTMQSDLESLGVAKAAGASAYVTKGAPIENLIEVLNCLGSEDQIFLKAGEFKSPVKKRDFKLTPREIEVLTHLPTGATAANIASLLFLTEATIKTHLASIYKKLGATNRAQAVGIAISAGLIFEK